MKRKAYYRKGYYRKCKNGNYIKNGDSYMQVAPGTGNYCYIKGGVVGKVKRSEYYLMSDIPDEVIDRHINKGG